MIRAAVLAWVALAAPALALSCRDVEFEGLPYTICEVAPRQERLSLFLDDRSGRPYGSFAAVEEENGPLAFAMNAGMYHEDRRPVGLFRQDGREVSPLVTQAGPGNFGLLPNGLLCLGRDGAFVIETLAYEKGGRDCESATQSGPMLVIDGELHPRFLPDSDSRYIRNGVGTSGDGARAVFAISSRPVTFHEFARFFRDGLGLPDALYFDGSISRLYAPALGRDDWGVRMGPIVGLLAEDAAP
ncbi:phosphodiester glycosidase family protein [Rubellimicrobium arenae]|uniref:phosphodiester glycosidase family protein n=1 Tax=Rubellimicrobium arenae TaxID=2817372 RepID=UPI001B3179A7